MSTVSIDRFLNPGEKATFSIEMFFFGDSRELEFPITTPRAAPLLSKVNNIFVSSTRGPNIEQTKGNYSFTRYVKDKNIDANFYILKIRLATQKQANKLKPGELINLSSSDAKLAQLNNNNYRILADSNRNPLYVNLRVNRTHQPTQNASGVSGSSVQEITSITKTRNYTVSVPRKVIGGLITERIPGQPLKKGMVEDIVVYAFKKFKGSSSASVPRKLMNTEANVDEKTPPSRSTVEIFAGKPSYTKRFVTGDDDKFIFYISIARYIYNGSTWEGSWVQRDASGNAIWGKAKPR